MKHGKLDPAEGSFFRGKKKDTFALLSSERMIYF